jgi:hypothetical protein
MIKALLTLAVCVLWGLLCHQLFMPNMPLMISMSIMGAFVIAAVGRDSRPKGTHTLSELKAIRAEHEKRQRKIDALMGREDSNNERREHEQQR